MSRTRPAYTASHRIGSQIATEAGRNVGEVSELPLRHHEHGERVMTGTSRKHKKRNGNHAKDSNSRRGEQQENRDVGFNPQQELLTVEKAQFNLLIKLTGLSLALSNFPLLRDELEIMLSTELSLFAYGTAQVVILVLIVLCALKAHRINQIQEGMQSDINDFYAKSRTRRLFKRLFGPGKHEDGIILTAWQRRLKKRGKREGIRNPEVLSDFLGRFSDVLGLLISFFALSFTALPIPTFNTIAAFIFLISPFVFSVYTLAYFIASNQHLVNRIIRNEKRHR